MTSTAAKLSQTARPIVSGLLVQAGWFACALEPVWKWPGLALVGVGVVVLIHLALVPERLPFVRWLAFAAAWGTVIDSFQSALGVLIFPEPRPGFACPLWFTCLWINFACVWPLGLSWLIPRPILAAGLGAVAGPASYYGGAELGSLGLGSPLWISLSAIGLAWGGTMAVWCRVARGLLAITPR